MRIGSLLLMMALLCSSCASILNGRYQKVYIYDRSQGGEILVNGEAPKKKNGKVLLERDREPKEITVKKDGYIDQHITVMQYKKSPLYILSWVPFGVLLYPPFYDNGYKAFNYDKEIIVGENMVSLPARDETSKEIRLNKVSVDIKADKLKYRYFSDYKSFIRYGKSRSASTASDAEDITLERTTFDDMLNTLLKDKGYIDTTRRVLKESYLNNMYVNASIKDHTVHYVNNLFGGMVYTDIVIEWAALDYYKKPVYTITTTTTSGQFAVSYGKKDQALQTALKNAIELGLVKFMGSEEVNRLLYDNSQLTLEANFAEYSLPRSRRFVSNFSEAVKSSVTIKNAEGHGSGFVVSGEGHIITNYHVVSDDSKIKVVLNNGKEYDAEVIRVSKIYDLALLKIEERNLLPFRISNSKQLELASDVYALGTPTAEDLYQTISRGIISGIRNMGDTELIQTDASINSGNSGGAMVDKNGNVIGVVSAKLKGFGIEGVAFGIPAYEIARKLKVSMN